MLNAIYVVRRIPPYIVPSSNNALGPYRSLGDVEGKTTSFWECESSTTNPGGRVCCCCSSLCSCSIWLMILIETSSSWLTTSELGWLWWLDNRDRRMLKYSSSVDGGTWMRFYVDKIPEYLLKFGEEEGPTEGLNTSALLLLLLLPSITLKNHERGARVWGYGRWRRRIRVRLG